MRSYTGIINRLRDDRDRLRSELRAVETALQALETGMAEESSVPRRTQTDRILEILREVPGRALKPRELADLMGVDNQRVGQLMYALKIRGVVQWSKGTGYWVAAENGAVA